MNSCLLSIGSVFLKFGFIIIALLVLMLMITIHELGHYTAGKILKFKINEFSIGFGKALYTKKKKSGEVFSIRLIPLGGYCAFDGEDSTDEAEDSFNAQAPWKRLIVLFCGAFFNFISAILFSVILLSVVGTGQIRVDKVEGVNNSIESFQAGDVIVEANGKKLSFFNGGLEGLTEQNKLGENITFIVVRDGKQQTVVAKKFAVMEKGSEVGKFGITPSYQGLSFGEACLKAVPFSFEMVAETLKALGNLIIGENGLQDIGGPITTISTMADAGAASLLNLLLIIPLIATSLAVCNLLPIPALDGCRMVFVLIEWIRKKPINRDLENKIHTVGLFILFGFVILVDFLHLFVF